jgi:hypothetical protein
MVFFVAFGHGKNPPEKGDQNRQHAPKSADKKEKGHDVMIQEFKNTCYTGEGRYP